MKLACVVHRYGADVAGGSETHCRDLAQRLAAHHDVTVLTTCARDYITWANAYPAGAGQDGPVKVMRFPVTHRRRLGRLRDISRIVFEGIGSPQEEEAWFRENGPDVPELLAHLQDRGREYDRVLFWSFRYATSFFGLPIVADRAILLPTAEEDPAIRLRLLEPFFTLPRGFLFLTPEERDLVASRVTGALPPCAIIGTGLDPAPPHDASALARLDLASPFALYLGRVERQKGCETLFRFFDDYLARSEESGSCAPLSLVIAGPEYMPVPSNPRVRRLGYVTDAVRHALLSEARVLVVPSFYESLSIVLLEAWNHGLPALVNGRCKVLEGQVRRSNGGLFYRHATEFTEGLAWFLEHRDAARQLGAQGRAYVEREYRWPVVLARVEEFLRDV